MMAEQETKKYKSIYIRSAHIHDDLITSGNVDNKNVLTKEILVSAVELLKKIVDWNTKLD